MSGLETGDIAIGAALLDAVRSGFEFETQEAFQEGREYFCAQLSAHNDTLACALAAQLRAPVQRDFQVQELPPEQALLVFWVDYFAARERIENTYQYLSAQYLIEAAVATLRAASESLPDVFADLLAEYAGLQILVCRIDRGIYTGQPELIESGARSLGKASRALRELATTSGCETLREVCTDFLDTLTQAYSSYAEACARVATLYQLRWRDMDTFRRALSEHTPSINAEQERLRKLGASIMASDLSPHLARLRSILSVRENEQGTLCIQDSSLEIRYFVAIDPALHREFSEHEPGTLDLTQLGVSDAPSEQGMTDIWSGLAEGEFLRSWSWALPALEVNLRGQDMRFAVNLHYLKMGVFVLSVCTPLRNMDITAARHMLELGSPFALDEEFRWQGENREFGLLYGFAEHVWEQVNSALCARLSKPGTGEPRTHAQIPEATERLFRSPGDDWFVSLRIDAMQGLGSGGQAQALQPAELARHPAFAALCAPLREARGSIDQWVGVAADETSANLAGIRFNATDFLFLQRNVLVLGLLDQPNWVRVQAEESLHGAAAIAALFGTTNEILTTRLRDMRNLLGDSDELNADHLSTRSLQQRTRHWRDERENLERLERQLFRLLDLVHAGSIMSYPDHSRLMRRVFDQMAFQAQSVRTRELLQEAREVHQQIESKLAEMLTRRESRRAKLMNSMLTAVTLLISVSALSDLFAMINEADLGWLVSARMQFGITMGVMLLVLLLVMKGSEPDE